MGNRESLAPNTCARFDSDGPFRLISGHDQDALAASEISHLNRLDVEPIGDVGDRNRPK